MSRFQCKNKVTGFGDRKSTCSRKFREKQDKQKWKFTY